MAWHLLLVEGNDLDETFLILLANAHDDEGSVPDEEVTSSSSCNSNLGAWEEDCLRIVASLSIRRCKVLLVSWWGVVVELGEAWRPVEEENSLNTVTAELIWVVWVELDPVLVLEHICVLELKTADGAILLFVSPVPKRDGLRSVSTECSDVLVVR